MKKAFINKKIISFIILIFFSTPLLNQNVAYSNSPDKNLGSEESIIYLDACSPYDYGLLVGKQFRAQYKLLDMSSRFLRNNNMNKEEIQEQINNIEKYCPFFLEELKGLSSSLGLKIERLIFIIKSIAYLFTNSCTTTSSTGPATKNNETFLTQNLDQGVNHISNFLGLIFQRLSSYKIKIVKINTINYRYAFLGTPILLEYPLMNEKGLGFGGNGLGLTDNKSRYIDEGPGISTYMLERLSMMTCKNVSEVADLWKNSERASGKYKDWPHFWDNSISMWCDKEGGILSIEQTHNNIITVFGNSTEITGAPEGILWHANIHQWLDPNLTGSCFPNESNTSSFRMKRARELLEKNYGNITLDVCKNIMSDHGGGSIIDGKDSYDICRHPDENLSTITSIAWIIQPKKLTVYLTHKSPCRSIFSKYDLSEIFEQ